MRVLNPVSLTEELERERPRAKHKRPTGRVTRTGTEKPKKYNGKDRVNRVAKWFSRDGVTRES